MQQITVYLQALGAHFLGANAYEVNKITVELIYSGGTINLPYAFPTQSGNDGINSPMYNSQSSFMPIITVSPSVNATSVVTFLDANADTICAKENFINPNVVELAHLNIHVPTPASANPMSIKYPVLLSPLRSNYKIIVAIPGLYLATKPINGLASVLVKMMCGCAITAKGQTPPSLWHPNDFLVQATVYDTTGGINQYTLSYTEDTRLAPNSLFTAPIPQLPNQISYITYTALQKSTNNFGTLTV